MFELPLKLSLYIFSFLNLQGRFWLRVVCRRWQEVLFHPFLLRHITVRDVNNPYKLCACLNFAKHVITLDIFNCMFWPMGGFSIRSITFPGIFRPLKRLYLRQTDLCSDTICEILQETTCLEVLDMTLSNATDAICEHICRYAQTLHVLKFDTDYEVPLPWSKEKIAAPVLQQFTHSRDWRNGTFGYFTNERTFERISVEATLRNCVLWFQQIVFK